MSRSASMLGVEPISNPVSLKPKTVRWVSSVYIGKADATRSEKISILELGSIYQ
ncbi:MAG: hypothetical protein F6K65_23840 [Moorea sp. SIO3C2]|nr:hypothetical protein [Moorena sp. SIO3C2]